MNKHTPGPWVADDNEGYSPWSVWSRMSPTGSGSAGPKVAEIIGDSAEADANARLIAAAPELLEALGKIAHYAECQVAAFASGRPYLDLTLFPSLCADARAAIAKATGQK